MRFRTPLHRLRFLLVFPIIPLAVHALPATEAHLTRSPGCGSLSLYSDPNLQNQIMPLQEDTAVTVLDDHSFGQQSLIQVADYYGFIQSKCLGKQIQSETSKSAPATPEPKQADGARPIPAYAQPVSQITNDQERNVGGKPADVGCSANISFAVVELGSIRPTVPNFVAKWVKNGKHLAKHPGFCFSQSPSTYARNFLIVFSNSASSYLGLYPTVRTNTTSSPVYGNGTVVDTYGQMWTYTYSGTVTTTTSTSENLPYIDTLRILYASAYTDRGQIVSHRWATVTTRQGGDPYNSLGYNLGSALGSIHLKEHLLESVLKDIH